MPGPDDNMVDWIANLIAKEMSGLVYVPNQKRIQEVGEAGEKLRTAFTEIMDDVQIRIEPNAMTKSGIAMIVKGFALEVDDITKFVEGISAASNFCVDPHTDGSVEFSIMFYDCYTPIGKI